MVREYPFDLHWVDVVAPADIALAIASSQPKATLIVDPSEITGAHTPSAVKTSALAELLRQ